MEWMQSAREDRDGGPDLVCAGEAMVMLVPEPPEAMSQHTSYRPTVAGAESNVAAFAAALGVRTAWVSRVGDDAFGAYLVAQLAALGVDVTLVERDQDRPTAVAFKEISPEGTRVAYFRRGSAASAMDRSTAAAVRGAGGRILHLSGITPALSGSCEELMTALTTDRAPGTVLSFDVNWRPALWSGDRSILLRLARAADIVFVGLDEAEALWGLRDVAAVRSLVPEPQILVVKLGATGATAFAGSEQVFVPSLDVRVIDPVGAGDAFAAGFLVATLRELSIKERLRLGTIVAASALRVPADVGPLPSEDHIDALLGLDDRGWSAARLEPLVGQLED